MDWEAGPDPERSARQRRDEHWRIFGIILVVIIGLAGLAMVAMTVLVTIALSSYGSNK